MKDVWYGMPFAKKNKRKMWVLIFLSHIFATFINKDFQTKYLVRKLNIKLAK